MSRIDIGEIESCFELCATRGENVESSELNAKLTSEWEGLGLDDALGRKGESVCVLLLAG